MHDDDNLSPDELALVLQLVNAKTQALTEAARRFQDTPRDGLADLETLGRPLLRDLRALAATLADLAEGLHQTADHVQQMAQRGR
jgi:hypothetical protein